VFLWLVVLASDIVINQGWAITGPRETCGLPQHFSGPWKHSEKILKFHLT